MGLWTKTSVFVFFIFCIACGNCDIEEKIQKCIGELQNEYRYYSPSKNIIHGLYWLDEKKFQAENTMHGDVNAYYTYLLNTVETNDLLNILSPEEYCDSKGYLIGQIVKDISGYNVRGSDFVELADHCNNATLLTRLKEMCVEALVDIGCTANAPGFECFKHFYLNFDKTHTRRRAGQRERLPNERYTRFLLIHVEDIYRDWRNSFPQLDDFNNYYYYNIKIGFIQGFIMKYTVTEISNINPNHFIEWRELCQELHEG